jgi:hypothetical protein
MKIFNIIQANTLIKYNCIVIGCGLGNKNKTYLEFKEDENFKKRLQEWLDRKI